MKLYTKLAGLTITEICLFSAQLLHVVTEDNQDAIRLVVSLPGTLSHLESVLDHTLPDDACGRGQVLVLQAAIAGKNVLQAKLVCILVCHSNHSSHMLCRCVPQRAPCST